jgi:hypothetical protein
MIAPFPSSISYLNESTWNLTCCVGASPAAPFHNLVNLFFNPLRVAAIVTFNRVTLSSNRGSSVPPQNSINICATAAKSSGPKQNPRP